MSRNESERVISSAGRASALQAEGRRFDPVITHHSLSMLRAAVVQSVRIPACHAGGRGFESRPLRHIRNTSPLNACDPQKARLVRAFLCACVLYVAVGASLPRDLLKLKRSRDKLAPAGLLHRRFRNPSACSPSRCADHRNTTSCRSRCWCNTTCRTRCSG